MAEEGPMPPEKSDGAGPFSSCVPLFLSAIAKEMGCIMAGLYYNEVVKVCTMAGGLGKT